jgi:hypothetical protein
MFIPAPYYLVPVLYQNRPLNGEFRCREAIRIDTLHSMEIPTAKALAFAEMDVAGVWMIVREYENTVSPQIMA